MVQVLGTANDALARVRDSAMPTFFLPILVAALGLLFSGHAVAQNTRPATLNWTDTRNPPGALYNVFRAPNQCKSGLTFSKIASNLTNKNYVDVLSPGSYCFQVTALSGGVESAPSNQVTAKVTGGGKPFATVLYDYTIGAIVNWFRKGDR